MTAIRGLHSIHAEASNGVNGRCLHVRGRDAHRFDPVCECPPEDGLTKYVYVLQSVMRSLASWKGHLERRLNRALLAEHNRLHLLRSVPLTLL